MRAQAVYAYGSLDRHRGWDPVGHLKRNLLAPRAKTQDHMNLIMQGQEIELAERYTNMTKMFILDTLILLHLSRRLLHVLICALG
jgi:hypothetical protein